MPRIFLKQASFSLSIESTGSGSGVFLFAAENGESESVFIEIFSHFPNHLSKGKWKFGENLKDIIMRMMQHAKFEDYSSATSVGGSTTEES